MEFEGTETVPVERSAAWDRITDPAVLTACVMGAEEITRVTEDRYEGEIRQRITGIDVALEGEVRIEERDRPEWLRFTGTGTDSRTGSRMDADVTVTLAEEGRATELVYDVDVTFTGRLATMGSRVLRRQVRANVETYFENLVDRVGARA
ncbi:carbon monoxide dehydrogenase subunit G [Halosimplex carlsbadense 2-9-1]|uniref:Carbon monoxide dehydrogenase subunit G n=1 Tax=Halosimplex carlsbadense 2-9-1 TaxID=797114 RepID=M0D6U4_9EURY|nr:SRPBCC domain-containing protein [Halosimplex carlsbadense]ELZ30528.1 carbon monoxide dehydrogenase subunit G [Halosimplex carlsbadense 2-9-1]